MPWVGKSTIGRFLATMLWKPFIDTDTYIYETTGKDPADHFANISDTEALSKEIELIKNIHQKNGVIALSWSVPMTDAGMDLVRSWGDIIIQLEADVNVIRDRIERRPDRYSRIIFWSCKNLEELRAFRYDRFEKLRTHTCRADDAPLNILHNIISHCLTSSISPLLKSTRTDTIAEEFRHAIFEARPSTGLWYRDMVRYGISPERRKIWSELSHKNPLEAFKSLWKFLDTGFSDAQISQAVERLSAFRHPDILPFRTYKQDISFLDLTQWPTCAFKDFALQILTSFISQDIDEHNKKSLEEPHLPKRYMIAQTSTSGDTGPAGGAGVQWQSFICNIIGYPEHEASYVQKQQMHELKGNVFSLGFRESFSSIQKSMLTQNTPEFQEKLYTICAKANPEKTVKIHAGSFNSINPGRIDAQMIYHAVAQFRASSEGLIWDDKKLAVVVPSGNGGHVFGALMARLLSGIPGPTIVSCNTNDFFEKLINHGTLKMPESDSAIHEPSVSMIIEYPNNMERLFRFAFWAEKTAKIMSDFFSGETVQLTGDEQLFLKSCLNIHAVRVTGKEELLRMQKYFWETGSLVCPHTANALCAWEKIQALFPNTHALICETASPWKFLASAATAVSTTSDVWWLYESLRPLESDYASIQELIKKIEIWFQQQGKIYHLPDFIKPWICPPIAPPNTLSCQQFGEKTLEIVQKWIQK